MCTVMGDSTFSMEAMNVDSIGVIDKLDDRDHLL